MYVHVKSCWLVLFWDGVVVDEWLPYVTFFIVSLVVVLHLGKSEYMMVQKVCNHWITSGNSTTVHVHVSFCCCCIHNLVVTGICCSMCYRDYFGEKIGIYLAWLGKCLHIVCIPHTGYWKQYDLYFKKKKSKACHVNCKLL